MTTSQIMREGVLDLRYSPQEQRIREVLARLQAPQTLPSILPQLEAGGFAANEHRFVYRQETHTKRKKLFPLELRAKTEECSHALAGSKAILKEMGYSGTEIGEICQWFELNGGYCDCEVMMNVLMREREYEAGRDSVP